MSLEAQINPQPSFTGRPPLRILVAEDNDGDILLIRRCLDKERLRYDMSVSKNGEDVLELLEERKDATSRPEILLLDLNLPRVNGNTVLTHLRGLPQYAGVPVIILTSSDSLSDRMDAFANGATHYFRKPTSLDAFMLLGSLVSQTLEDAGSGPAFA